MSRVKSTFRIHEDRTSAGFNIFQPHCLQELNVLKLGIITLRDGNSLYFSQGTLQQTQPIKCDVTWRILKQAMILCAT